MVASASFEIYEITKAEYRTEENPDDASVDIPCPKLHVHVTWMACEPDGSNSTTIEPCTDDLKMLPIVSTFLAKPCVVKSLKANRVHAMALYNEQLDIKKYVDLQNLVHPVTVHFYVASSLLFLLPISIFVYLGCS